MICKPCKATPAQHLECQGGTWCDCQHREPAPTYTLRVTDDGAYVAETYITDGSQNGNAGVKTQGHEPAGDPA